MILEQCNINSLLIFNKVIESGNMTIAARELGMTQSGVSQHISNLEDILEVQLFERLKRKIIPTKEAEILYNTSKQSFFKLEQTLFDLSKNESFLSGIVNIGVPVEFGNNIILPMLAKINKESPEIKFNITYELALELNNLLLAGKIDLAFVDEFVMDKSLTIEQVFEEHLYLCCSKNYIKDVQKFDRKFFENAQFVSYLKGAPVVREWLDRGMNIKKIDLNLVARATDVQGIKALIENDMGIGVLPRHATIGTDLHFFKAKSEKVINHISMAYFDHRLKNPLIAYVYESLKRQLS